MARTKGKGSKATLHKNTSPSSSPPTRSPSPPSPPPKPNSPSSSSSLPLLTPPSSFIEETPETSSKHPPKQSLDHSPALVNLDEITSHALDQEIDPKYFHPLVMILHPLFQTEAPNLSQVPPHLKNFQPKPNPNFVRTTQSKPSKTKVKPTTRKAKSFQNLRTRRSQRLISGFGTKKHPIIDNTVYEISEEDSSHDKNPSKTASKSVFTIPPKKAPSKSPSKKETFKTDHKVLHPNRIKEREKLRYRYPLQKKLLQQVKGILLENCLFQKWIASL